MESLGVGPCVAGDVVPALKKLRGKDGEFKASLGYIRRLSLRQTKNNLGMFATGQCDAQVQRESFCSWSRTGPAAAALPLSLPVASTMRSDLKTPPQTHIVLKQTLIPWDNLAEEGAQRQAFEDSMCVQLSKYLEREMGMSRFAVLGKGHGRPDALLGHHPDLAITVSYLDQTSLLNDCSEPGSQMAQDKGLLNSEELCLLLHSYTLFLVCMWYVCVHGCVPLIMWGSS